MGFRRRKVNKRIAAGNSLRTEDDVECVDVAGNASGLEKVIASRQLSRDLSERRNCIVLGIFLAVGTFMLTVVSFAIRFNAPLDVTDGNALHDGWGARG